MEKYLTDWKNEHLWSEGWRMKGWISDVFTGAISLVLGGIKFHIHHYTTINVPAPKNHGPGMDPSRWAFTPSLMCRCGHKIVEHYWHD